jgi:transposase
MRYIGVDLHKTNFVVCFLSEDDRAQTETFLLNAEGLTRFKRRLRPDDQLAVEASANTFYFCRQVKERLAKVVVVDTYRFAVIARSKKKTDKKDALMLARFLKLGWLPEVSVPSEQIEQLRHLLQARESLVRMLTQLKNMAHASLVRSGYAMSRSAFASPRTRGRMAKLENLTAVDRQIIEMALRQMQEIEQEVGKLEAEIIERGKGLRGLPRLLQIHGMNLLAAIGLLVEIGDIEQFETSKQLVAYAGLAASVRQSNQSERRGKITKQGRKRLRTIVIRAVLSMVNRTKTPLMEFYAEKKREKGAGKAICATARKLLVIVFVMLKKELDYWYVEDRLYNQKLKALRACA